MKKVVSPLKKYKGKYLTCKQVEKIFPEQFVLLQDPVMENFQIVGGTFVYAAKTRIKLKPHVQALGDNYRVTMIDTHWYDPNADFCL